MFNKLLAELGPIYVGERGCMCIPISRCPSEFHENRARVELLKLARKTSFEYAHFLAERRRRSRLPMRACEHRCRSMSICNSRDFLLEHFKSRQYSVLDRITQEERVGDTVHVFRGEREVKPFAHVFERGDLEFTLQEILDSLHVVVRRGDAVCSFVLY